MAKEEKHPVDFIESTIEKHNLGESVTCERDKHFFISVSGTEAECRKCHIGFVLPVGGEAREGHIYLQGEFVI